MIERHCQSKRDLFPAPPFPPNIIEVAVTQGLHSCNCHFHCHLTIYVSAFSLYTFPQAKHLHLCFPYCKTGKVIPHFLVKWSSCERYFTNNNSSMWQWLADMLQVVFALPNRFIWKKIPVNIVSFWYSIVPCLWHHHCRPVAVLVFIMEIYLSYLWRSPHMGMICGHEWSELDLIDLEVSPKASTQLSKCSASYFHILFHTTSHLLLHFFCMKIIRKALKIIKT